MCFKTIGSARAMIAKKDIECWKVIRKNNTPVYTWVHGIMTPYYKNELCPKVKLIEHNGDVYRGYHSCKEKDRDLISYACWCGPVRPDELKICKFIIPAGTRYYENNTEYVSETIIML
jgi:hypothetical protein